MKNKKAKDKCIRVLSSFGEQHVHLTIDKPADEALCGEVLHPISTTYIVNPLIPCTCELCFRKAHEMGIIAADYGAVIVPLFLMP